MAYCNTLSLILLLFVALNPLAVHGQISIPPVVGVVPPIGVPLLGFIPITIIVRGQLCCTANGNCPGQGLVGVNVTLTCPNLLGPPRVSRTVSNQSRTDANGTFTLTLQTHTLFGMIPLGLCRVTTPLPVGTTGLGLGRQLRSGIQSTNPSITISPVVNAVATGFIMVTDF